MWKGFERIFFNEEIFHAIFHFRFWAEWGYYWYYNCALFFSSFFNTDFFVPLIRNRISNHKWYLVGTFGRKYFDFHNIFSRYAEKYRKLTNNYKIHGIYTKSNVYYNYKIMYFKKIQDSKTSDLLIQLLKCQKCVVFFL